MRLLHIAKYAPPEPGGMETFVRDLSVEQVRQGQDVTVLCHQPASLAATELCREDGVEVVRCATLCRTPFLPAAPLFPACLKRAVARARPDVIHLHLPNPAVLFQAFLPDDVPLVIHWHADVQGASSGLIRTLYPLYRFFERRVLARADRIVVTSSPYLESSPTLAPWRSRCTVVPLGLDTARYPLAAEVARPERPLVLAAGRFAYYKGFEFLVGAATLVPEATFAILGNGPERARVAGQVERLGLWDRVSLPGRVSDAELCGYMQRASVFCLPSVDRGEAFGVVLLEAMRYGLPLITTAIPGSGTGWVNRAGETGLVVPPADSAALALAVRQVLADPALARRYGQAGRNRLEKEFTISGTVRSLDRIYEDVAGT